MNISLNIILDKLSKYHINSHVSEYFRGSFSGLELLTFGSDMNDNCDKLFIGRLSQALMLRPEQRCNAVIICLRDRIKDESESEAAMAGIIEVNENISYEKLFSIVQEIFTSISNWYLDAREAIINNCPLQDVIDISEEILENYVQITDSSFTLLGYTRGIECDDEITVLARRNGYHPESTIKLFDKYHRTELWENSYGILTNTDHLLSSYDLISRIFRFSNTYFAHVVMTCNKTENTPGRQEIFSMFTDLISVYVEKSWEMTNNCHHPYDSFLHDLYCGGIARKDIANERAAHLGIPMEGVFCLSLTSKDESNDAPIGRISSDIMAIRPFDRITNMHGQIAILSQLPQEGFLDSFAQLKKDLEQIMCRYNLRCGISTIFNNLTEAYHAYTEAAQALSYSGCTPGAVLLPVIEGASNGLQKRAVSFEESFFYILLGKNPENKEIWRSSVYYNALCTLRDYDEVHNMNNLHLLYVYLLCESRPTETAKAMFMTRNNVVYRIERIQEMLNMNLDTPSVRLKLVISYALMQLYGLD